MTPRKYIVFKWTIPETKETRIRKMLVIDGQPYYCSTGTNSTHEGVWFPFMMMAGTKSAYLGKLPSFLRKSEVKERIKTANSQHIVKFARVYFYDPPEVFYRLDEEKGKHLISRLPTKTTAMTSVRLSGDKFPKAGRDALMANLFFHEHPVLDERIPLESKPVFVTSDPDAINTWIISQGATLAIAMLHNQPKREPTPYSPRLMSHEHKVAPAERVVESSAEQKEEQTGWRKWLNCIKR